MPLLKALDPNECKNFVRDLNGTDSAERNQYAYDGSFIYLDRLSFQVQIEKKTNSIDCNQTEYCTYWCLHISTKIFCLDY